MTKAVIEVEVYACGSCGNEYENESDAEECCPNYADAVGTRFKCPMCGDLHVDEKDAKDCCDDEKNE